jgi:hypothetical protein
VDLRWLEVGLWFLWISLVSVDWGRSFGLINLCLPSSALVWSLVTGDDFLFRKLFLFCDNLFFGFRWIWRLESEIMTGKGKKFFGVQFCVLGGTRSLPGSQWCLTVEPQSDFLPLLLKVPCFSLAVDLPEIYHFECGNYSRDVLNRSIEQNRNTTLIHTIC